MSPEANSLARVLAWDGCTASQIKETCDQAGYPVTEDEAKEVWLQCDQHRKDWAKALQADVQ